MFDIHQAVSERHAKVGHANTELKLCAFPTRERTADASVVASASALAAALVVLPAVWGRGTNAAAVQFIRRQFEHIDVPSRLAQRGGREQSAQRATDDHCTGLHRGVHAALRSSAARSALANTAGGCAPLIASPAMKTVGTERMPCC